jgi:hypothetical protein
VRGENYVVSWREVPSLQWTRAMETHVGILSESLAALQTGCTAGLLLHSCVRHAAPAWRTGSTREQRHGGGVVQHEVAGMAAIQMSYVEAVNAQATGPSMIDV